MVKFLWAALRIQRWEMVFKLSCPSSHSQAGTSVIGTSAWENIHFLSDRFGVYLGIMGDQIKPLYTSLYDSAVMVRGGSGGPSIIFPWCRETLASRTTIWSLLFFFRLVRPHPKEWGYPCGYIYLGPIEAFINFHLIIVICTSLKNNFR